MSERDKLKKLAEAATPGPWEWGSDRNSCSEAIVTADPTDRHTIFANSGRGSGSPEDRDAHYIAAANPSTILALLAELEQAERERDEASAETAACLKFLSNTLHWEGFRLEMLTEKDDVKKSNSHQENIRLLSNYLAEKGHGVKLLAALRTLRQASAQAHHWLLLVTLDFPKGSLCHSKSEAVAARLAAALAAEGGK